MSRAADPEIHSGGPRFPKAALPPSTRHRWAVRDPRRALGVLALAALAVFPGAGWAQAPTVREQDVQAMKWRNIGPTRGGRSVAVAGVPGDPFTYYFGGTGGGVWKTTDGGQSWTNVSDGFLGTGSVGAVAVSESDPNVVYVGMGEHAVRGVATSHGDGVYRSTDAGKTWAHRGLPGSRAISRIRVHPADPDLVYVAVQGAPHGPTAERGIYRSRDGGGSWERIHFVSERAGASELAMDMTNPRILYAAYWDHLRRPWLVESGGEGSGIWKSVDGGDTWTELTQGLPDPMGKIGIDVSRANPDRVFANIEAGEGKGGVYRSDDGGSTWTQTSADRITQTRSWYYMEIFADPQDQETVYVLNAPFLKSIDGGRTFTQVQVPHGDNHDLWINPRDHRFMVNANDGGGNVSFNGGRTWSDQRGQPTAQFYRVITDDRFPYHVYGGQQDNSAVGIASASPGGIGWEDFYSVSGCESAYLAFDPADPEDVFGGCYQGLIDVWSRSTGDRKPIMAYPYLGLGTEPRSQRYRFNWNAPIVASPHDPSVIYHGGNVLLKTTDRGQSWTEISPDLTRNEVEKQGPGGGPITNEAAGGENYNTIFYVVESTRAAGTIWVGTDDGLVHLTRDGGGSWTDVTPPGVGEALVNSIEASPHDPASAWVVVTRYKYNDFTPHIYRTTDHGRSWVRAVDGIDPEAWVRVVREDPERPGLLYAGTETGMYLSLDAGRRWQKWQLNLPIVPVTDLTVRRGDLVAATQGRAFWILDDLSPVRQLGAETMTAAMHLYTPRETHLVEWGGGFGGGPAGGVGANPPSGAQIFYSFAEAPEDPVTIEILDGDGRVVRTYATDPAAAGDESFTKLEKPEAGLNRSAWNFRHESISGLPDGYFVFGSTNGRLALPGEYQVRLTAGSETRTATLRLLPDPRRGASVADLRAQDAFLAEAAAMADEIHRSVRDMVSVRDQVKDVVERTAHHDRADEIETAGDQVVEAVDEWEGGVVQPEQKTFQDVINFQNRLNAQVIALMGSVDGTEPPLTAGARERLRDLQAEWVERRSAMEGILEGAVAAFNALVREAGIQAVIVPERRRVASDDQP